MVLCKKIIILIIVLLFLILFLGTDETVTENTSSPLPDKDKFENVRSEILKYIKEKGISSIAVAVAKDGKIIWEEGFGWASREMQIKWKWFL